MRISPLILPLLAVACVSKTKVADVAPAPTPQTAKISVMTYNVENLFDQQDDTEKNDETFLPPEEKGKIAFQNRCRSRNRGRYMYECLEKDWSSPIVKRKLSRIADVVAQVNKGHGPDILILEEVENERILKRWNDEYLKNMGYTTVAILEGEDERGIDTAILSRLPLAEEPKLHLIDFSKDPEIKKEEIKPTRGILEARLKLPNGDKLAVFAVHFPSQGAPTIFRKAAMNELMEVTSKVPAGTQVLVGGDFNITSREDWQQKYFRDIAGKRFAISHMIGCTDCAGTTYFPPDKTWSFFDVLMVSKDMYQGNANWQIDPASVQIMNHSIYQVNRYGTPARFGSGKGSVGVSDHWPMYAELKLKPVESAEVTK